MKTKRITAIIGCMIAVACAALVAACGDAKVEEKGEISALRGSFTYQATIGDTIDQLTISNDPSTTDSLYCSYEPFSRAWDYGNGGKALLSYSINQQLKLNANFTYSYKYTIVISNPNTWGSEIGRMNVDVNGTFTYADLGDGIFEVEISNPTAGTQEIYGIDANGLPGASDNAYYWHWRVHTEPDFVQDFSHSDIFSEYDYTFVGARKLKVNKTDKTLDDNMFIPAVFNEMAKYGNY